MLITIYGKDIKLHGLIKKNMLAHEKRNSKTTLIYTIALSFLIFAGAGFALQGKPRVLISGDRIKVGLQKNICGDIRVQSVYYQDPTGINEQGFREFFERYNKLYPDRIEDISFISVPFMYLPQT